MPPPRAENTSVRMGISQLLGLAALALVGTHLAFSRQELSVIVRLLLTCPGLLCLWEVNRFTSTLQSGKRELPFLALGLFYFYIAFSFPSLFDLEFVDLSGRVVFTDNAKFSGGLAVAVGSLCMFAGMRLGEAIGQRLKPGMITLLPPAELPPAFAQAVLWYGGLCVFVMLLSLSAPGSIPVALELLVSTSVTFELVIGLPIVKPEHFQGPWSRYTSIGFMLIGWVGSLLRGQLDGVQHLAAPLLAGRWVYLRKASIQVLAGALGIYLLFQPVKSDFRAQVWGRTQVTYTERVEAWNNAFTNFFSSRDANEDQIQTSAVSRLAEFDPVLHAFDMLPGQVQPLDGSGWVVILTGPIPRLIWPDKPTTKESADQRYAVEFHRQSEEGARTTAVTLPLLVDGYWNFGWPGILFACVAMGLWVGVCQKLWSAGHWALEAIGLVYFGRLQTHGQLNSVYGGLFQSIVGMLVATWGIYGLGALLSGRGPARGRQGVFGGRGQILARRSGAR